MAENINITCSIRNETGNTLTVPASSLSWGKFRKSPHSLSNSDKTQEAFKASGRKDSASGTEGYVSYAAFDGTVFRIDFDIKWGTKANSISNTMPEGKGNPSNFIFKRMNSDYTKELTGGDPGSSPVKVYYLIQKKASSG